MKYVVPDQEAVDLLAHDVLEDWEETFGKEETVEFIRKGMNSIEQHLEELAAVLDDDDAEEFIEVVHKLSGVSGFCGMKALHELTSYMEEAAKKGLYEEARAKSPDVSKVYKSCLDKLREIYPLN